MAPCEWNDHKINVIDTPGYFDFVGGVMEGIRVADAAIILVGGKSGVEVGTEKCWEYAEKRKIPKMVFINRMDEENINYSEIIDQLRDKFGKSIAPFQVPIFENNSFVGFVNVVDMTARKFEGGKVVNTEIPDGMDDMINPIREMIMEAVAETSEELMEKYFEGEEFTNEEVQKALKAGIDGGEIVPVLCGSAYNNAGVQVLMDSIIEFTPSPDEVVEEKARLLESNEEITVKCSEDEPASALIFKTIVDPYVGKVSLFKVMSGTISADTVLFNSNNEKNAKIAKLYTMRGKKQIEIKKLSVGDIGAVTKLADANTGDTLCDPERKIVLEGIDYPEPVISLAIKPKDSGDEEKIGSGIQRLIEEDPTINMEMNTETHQQLISGVGEQHLDIVVSKLQNRYGVSVELLDPKVPYRETIRGKVKVEGKHKKQSGGHGQYGHVWIEFEPGEQEDLTFEEKIFGGAVPKNYIPAVEKGLRESMEHGVLAGYPVVNLKATLVDGSYHPVDSSEMAFKVAASLAYKKGMEQANPVLLEPIANVEVYVPDENMGDIIGDLNKRRGRILGMNPQGGGIQQVVAEVPMAEMFKYATDLRSMTQGRAVFKMEFLKYEEVPANIAEKVIEEAKKEDDE